MDRKCCICGHRFPEKDMVRTFVGKPIWRCWDCYKQGHGEVTGVESQAIMRRMKEVNKRK